jgi:oxygen-independent coproporphyrinogen-3 oxidase
LEERFFVGLRLREGVSFSESDRVVHGAALERFLGMGLLEWVGDRVRLTDRGILLSNDVFQEFLL